MRVSRREMVLGWLTLVTLISGATYWVAAPRAEEWREMRKARTGLEQRRVLAERLLGQKGDVNARLGALRKQLPQYPVGQDVTAELLKTLERTARDHGLMLVRREPDKEKSVGDLFEVSINVTWEGNLDSIVHFLYAWQAQGAILDIRQLTIQPGQPGQLKGNFTVDFAYSRGVAGGEATAPEKTAEK